MPCAVSPRNSLLGMSSTCWLQSSTSQAALHDITASATHILWRTSRHSTDNQCLVAQLAKSSLATLAMPDPRLTRPRPRPASPLRYSPPCVTSYTRGRTSLPSGLRSLLPVNRELYHLTIPHLYKYGDIRAKDCVMDKLLVGLDGYERKGLNAKKKTKECLPTGSVSVNDTSAARSADASPSTQASHARKSWALGC